MFGRIGHIRYDSVIHIISNLYADTRITGHVGISVPAIGIHNPRGINRAQIKLALIGDAIRCYGVRKQVPSVGLDLHSLTLSVNDQSVTEAVTRSPLSHKPGILP